MDRLITTKRIGRVFLAFSLSVVIANIAVSILDSDLTRLTTLEFASYVAYCVGFCVSIVKPCMTSKLLQVAIIYIESIKTLSSETGLVFFSISFMIIAVILAFEYGFFVTYKKVKISIALSINYLLMVMAMPSVHANKWTSSLLVMMFGVVFIYILWLIIKERYIKYKASFDAKEHHLNQTIAEYNELAHISTATMEEMISKLEATIKTRE